MKTYRVKAIFTQLKVYRVQAEDEQEAEDNFAEGDRINTDDETLDNTVLSVVEMKP